MTPADRAYCRGVLPEVSRTFALNIRLLSGRLRESVAVAYLLCRTADALEDSWPGTPETVGERFDRLLGALEGDAEAAERLAREASATRPANGSGPAAAARSPESGEVELGLVAHLPAVLRVYRQLPETDGAAIGDALQVMARGMRRYAVRAAARPPGVAYLDTEAELDDYCWVVAGCVGVLLTRLFGARIQDGPGPQARRLALAPTVGRALQLTNILLDWPVDVRRGRCHVPASWLDEAGLEPRDLVGAPRPEIAGLVDRLESRARDALAEVPSYLDRIPRRFVRIRLFCLWPTLWALGSLAAARSDPEFPWGPRRPRLSRPALRRAALASLFRGHSPGGVRRLYAAPG